MTGWPRIALLSAAALIAAARGPTLAPPQADLQLLDPGLPPPDAPIQPDAPARPDGDVPAVWIILPPARTADPHDELVAAWRDLPAGAGVVAAVDGHARLYAPPGGSVGEPPRSAGGGVSGGPIGDLLELGVDTALSWRTPELVVWSPVLEPDRLRRRADAGPAIQRAEAAGVRVTFLQPTGGQDGAR